MTFQRRSTLSPLKEIRWRESPEARPGDQGLLSSSRSWGDTWTWSLLADFLTFTLVNTSKITICNVSWSLQNSTLYKSAITNSMHSKSKYTVTPPLPKQILNFKQFVENLRNIFTSVSHARKSWIQLASSFPWFTSKTKRWNLGLILPGLQITGLQLC